MKVYSFFLTNYLELKVLNRNMLICAIESDELSLLQWIGLDLIKDNFFWDEHTCLFAANFAAINCLKWFRSAGCDWNECTGFVAALNGDLDQLKWVVTNLSKNFNQISILNHRCLFWLVNQKCTANICSFAAYGENLECLKLLREKKFLYGKDTCASAALHGNIDILKWLRGNECDWGEYTCASAVQGRHFDCLKWLRENGCPWDDSTCEDATINGDLNILEWARENGCPWNAKSIAYYASENGHLSCLKYVVKTDYPWGNDDDDDVIRYTGSRKECLQIAEMQDHLDIVNWIKETVV